MTTVSWASDVSGNWSTASDWAGGSVPSATSGVLINVGGIYTVTVSGPIQFSALAIAAAGATMDLTAALSTSATQSISVAQGVIALDNNLTTAGMVSFGLSGQSIVGATVYGGGTLVTSGTTTVNDSDSGSYPGNQVALTLGGINWTNSGAINDAGLILVGFGGETNVTLTNQATGTFDITSNDANIGFNSGASASFTNAGLLEKTGGAGTSNFAARIVNSGSILVSTGVLNFSGGGSIAGVVSGGGSLAFSAGSINLTATSVAAGIIVDGGTVNLGTSLAGQVAETSGALAATASVTLSQAYSDTQGALSVASGATLTVANTATFGIAGQSVTGAQVYGGGTLLTSGTTTVNDSDSGSYPGNQVALSLGGINWTNSGAINDAGLILVGNTGGANATFTNQATGTFDITSNDGNIGLGSGASAGFTNAGLLEKTGGAGTSNFAASVTNTGRILGAVGTLQFAALVKNNGTIEDALGSVNLVGGVATTGTAKGALQIDAGGTIEIGGATSAGETVTFGAGSSASPAKLILDNSVQFSGTINGATFENAYELIDLKDISYSNIKALSFKNITSASATLVVSDGTHTANLILSGKYTVANLTNFHVSSDGAGGVILTDPRPAGHKTVGDPLPLLIQAIASFGGSGAPQTETVLSAPVEVSSYLAVSHCMTASSLHG
jgi:hypothetical protein